MSSEVLQHEITPQHQILESAMSLWNAGLSIVPGGDGHWLPRFTRYLNSRPVEDQIRQWFSVQADIVVMCGQASGGVYCLDFDNKSGGHGHVFPTWKEKLQSSVPSLLAKLCIYRTKTAGGYRVCWRCETEPAWFGNDVAVVLYQDQPKAIIECLKWMTVPGGATLSYEYVSDKRLFDLPIMRPHEQDLLLSLAREFHEHDEPERVFKLPADPDVVGARPGDYFNKHAVWSEILEPKGWSLDHIAGNQQFWTRPGKNGGTSARIGYKGYEDSFYVFSGNASPLQRKTGYTPFSAYSLLHHGGDFSSAARTICESGFGSVRPFSEVETAETTEVLRQLDEAIPPVEIHAVQAAGASVQAGEQAAVTATEKDGWGEPLDLEGGDDLPPFPVEALAKIVPEYAAICHAIHEHIQVPIDVPGCVGLAVLGVPVARYVKIAVRPGAYEEAVVWTICGLPPGERKTPAVNVLRKSLVDWEIAQREGKRDEITQQRAKRKMAAGRQKALEKMMFKAADKEELDRIQNEYAELEMLLAAPEPEAPRLLIDDATPEAVVPFLLKHDYRAACISDEASFVEVALGRYSGTPNLDLYLRAWSGSDVRLDRARHDAILLPEAYLTLGLCIQPKPLMKLAGNEDAEERGFVPRFLAALPKSMVGGRKPNMEGIPQQVVTAWEQKVEHMLKQKTHRRLDHTPEGWQWIAGTEKRYEPLLAENRELAPLRGWVAKAFPGQVLRVAAILHCATGAPTNTVEVSTLKAATQIVEYFLEHAKKIRCIRKNNVALDLAKEIRDNLTLKCTGTFTWSDFKTNFWAGRTATEKAGNEVLNSAYDLLIKANIIRANKKVGPGCRFTLNPSLFERSREV